MGLPARKIEEVKPLAPPRPDLRIVEGSLRGAATLSKHVAGIYRGALKGLLTGKKPDFDGLTARIAGDISAIAKGCMDLSVEEHGQFPKLKEGERGVVISNHPTYTNIWCWGDSVARNFSPNMKLIAKKEMMHDLTTAPPIMGWPGKWSKILVMIDRGDREAATEAIRKACEETFMPGDAMVIYPDAHRPSERRIRESHAKMAEKYPNLPEMMPHTCFPKGGGLFTILNATRDYPTRILNMTIGSSGMKDQNGFGSTVHIHGEELAREYLLGRSGNPEKEQLHLKEKLVQEWKRKNRMIETWQNA